MSWHLKSSATGLFVQQLIQADTKENILARHFTGLISGYPSWFVIEMANTSKSVSMPWFRNIRYIWCTGGSAVSIIHHWSALCLFARASKLRRAYCKFKCTQAPLWLSLLLATLWWVTLNHICTSAISSAIGLILAWYLCPRPLLKL